MQHTQPPTRLTRDNFAARRYSPASRELGAKRRPAEKSSLSHRLHEIALAGGEEVLRAKADACGGVLSVASIPAHHARKTVEANDQVPRTLIDDAVRGEQVLRLQLRRRLLAGMRLR
jgi:hypothetical protein